VNPVRGSKPSNPVERSRPAGIRDIAEALGVSIGTVDRALHNRPRISAKTREKVLRQAAALGYQPNLAARYLSSGKERRIAVCLPREVASFFDLVRAGISDAAKTFEAGGVRLVYEPYERLGVGENEAMKRALENDIDGLLIAPGRPDKLKPLIRAATRRGIPVVCVSTDAPDTERVAAVSVDPVTSGALVGELMGRFLRGQGRVVVVTGLLRTLDHAGKLEGFQQAIRDMWPQLEIGAVLQTHDDEAEAYDKCRKLLARHPEVSGIYVSTANSLPVMRAIDDLRLGSHISVITTDLFAALVPLIESGRIAATIHQRAWTQGRIAFQTIHRLVVEGIAPPPHVRLSPNIVMKSNVKLFLDRLGTGSAAPSHAAAPARLEGVPRRRRVS
jgi:LacI family transcriptional regulator